MKKSSNTLCNIYKLNNRTTILKADYMEITDRMYNKITMAMCTSD